MLGNDISHLKTSDLLSLRFCDIDALKEPPKRDLVLNATLELRRNLYHAGLLYVEPDIYLGDEWFTPSGVCSIAVPFYLAHPRLTKLEREMKKSAEGAGSRSCIKLLRHEAGHCFDHLYRFSETKNWQELFGNPKTPYHPDTYQPNRSSRDFVHHLPDFYAQAHPDEDFAETFAIVITPESHWWITYKKYPNAMAKLVYVYDLIQRYGHKKPKSLVKERCFEIHRKRMTLARHYQKGDHLN